MTQVAEKTQKSQPKSAQIKDAAFKWDDPLDLEGELTEEERMVRDTARDYAQEKLFPRVIAANRDGQTDPAIFREMGELGLLGSTIPEEYGGAGLGYVCYGLIARELERVDSGFRSAMSVQSSLAMQAIYAYGSEAQRRKYLPKMATGELLGCFGLTEPDHGSDPGSHGDARRESAGRLSASPAPRPGSPMRRSPTSASSGRSSTAGSAASSSSAAPRDFPRRRSKASCRCAPRSPARSCSKARSCPKTICCRMCPASPARSAASTWRAPASPGAPWAPPNSAGIAPAITCSTRKQFGRPLAANQLVQKKLADMQTEITLGLHAALRLSRLIDAGQGVAAGDLAAQAQQLRQGARDRPRSPATCTAATALPRNST